MHCYCRTTECQMLSEEYSVGCYDYLLNPLNAKLNPICHLLALLGSHHILHVSRIRVNELLQILQCY